VGWPEHRPEEGKVKRDHRKDRRPKWHYANDWRDRGEGSDQ
jgi:hypothetical protein